MLMVERERYMLYGAERARQARTVTVKGWLGVVWGTLRVGRRSPGTLTSQTGYTIFAVSCVV